jgi:cystathionine beta-lyase
MKYNFDKVVKRIQSEKWDEKKEIFGTEDVTPMWVADMDFESPKPVIDAIIKRAEHGLFGYTFKSSSYYESIINWFNKRYNWEINKDWINYSPGVVPALSFITLSFSQPGDKIIVQSPVYRRFLEVIMEDGRQILDNELKLKNGKYVIDFDDFEKKASDPRAKLFFLCNPHNPVGRVWTREDLIRLGKICIKNNVIIVSDEIHSDLIYEGYKHVVFASISEEFAQNSITLNSPSKTFNLAGLQTSVIIIPNKKYYEIYQSELSSLKLTRGNVFGLVALEAAYNFGEDWLEQLLVYLEENVKYLMNFFEEKISKIKVIKPEGTYLVWLDCRQLGLNDLELRKFMIEKAKVGLLDGYKFGQGGEGFQRINIGCPRVILKESLERIEKAVNGIAGKELLDKK